MALLTCGAAAFIFALLAVAQGQWMNSMTNAMIDHEKAASVSQLVAEGGGISTETCGGPDDALKVEKVDVQMDGLALVVRGSLLRRVQGGTVHATVRLIKPKGLSVGQHFKYIGAMAFTRSRKFSEPLCKHLGLPIEGSNDEGGCILQPGSHDMRFSFKSLPKMVFVGKYVLEINVVDEVGQPITCARGSLSIQAGKSNGVLRKLESGCPGLIMDNLHDVESLSVSECDAINLVNIDVTMKPGLDYYLIGHWREFCTDGSNGLTVYKRHPELWKFCASQDECDFGCPNVECKDDGHGDFKCMPMGETSCEEEMYYDISPQEVRDSCHEGGVSLVSAAAALHGVARKLAATSLLALATLFSFLH